MRNILIPVELSETSNSIVTCAIDFAKQSSCKVWLLHVILPTPETVPFPVDLNILRKAVATGLHYQRHQLHDLAEQFREENIRVFPYHVIGNIEKTILNQAKRVEADLIIMGTHRHSNVYHAVLGGGIGQKVIRLASCPVLLVSERETRDRAHNWKKKILNIIHHDTHTG